MAPARDMSGPKIYFVRHGETDWNVAGRMQGQQDISLNEKGRGQAEQVGYKLAKLFDRPEIMQYLVSPLKRTRETADIMLRTMGLAPDIYQPEPRLREITFGKWEGLTWKDVRKTDPAAALQRDMDKWGTVPPDGESYAMLAERVRPVFENLERDIVVVSHGGVARATLAVMDCIAPEKAPVVEIWQGRILVIAKGSYQWV
ncbi:histidine phosphatase family protein [Microvirga sp. W0021]|uniref:Histidine phosphatase family protein n=1 Tax=Hohaiivirga grylli TaxID=3133970 RepID=A0ABV0BH42_9HYPH